MSSGSPRKRSYAILRFVTIWFALVGLDMVGSAFVDLLREVPKLPDEMRYEAGGALVGSLFLASIFLLIDKYVPKKEVTKG